MTLSPTNSRWSYLLILCALAFFPCMLVPLPKKSSRFLLFSLLFSTFPCIQFIANPSVNSLHILVRSYLPKWAEVTIVFLWVELGLTGLFPSAKPNHLGATENNNSVLPISMMRKILCHLHPAYFFPAPLNDTCPLPASYYMSLWNVTQGPNLFDSHSRRSLLGNWCQRGRESSHQSLITSKGENA